MALSNAKIVDDIDTSFLLEEEKYNMDDNDDDDNMSWDSIISEPRTPEWYSNSNEDEKEKENLTKEERTFLEGWDALERKLKQRMDHLRHISRHQSKAFRDVLVRRELAAATKRRQDFVRRYAGSSFSDTKSKTTFSWSNWYQEMVDFIVFEWHTTVRAVAGLFLHSVGMGGFYFLVEILIQKTTTFLALYMNLTFFLKQPFASAAVLFVIGAAVTRCSGYLYWWLNDTVHDYLKFDYHNRLRLGFPGAAILNAARSNLVGRALVYLIGYNICFQVADTSYGLVSQYMVPSASPILERLPSHHIVYDPYWNDDRFVCDRTCAEETAAREAFAEALWEDDFSFTKTHLSMDAHYTYWMSWVNQDDAFSYSVVVTEYTWMYGFILSIVWVVVCVALLRLYGFVFWKNVTV